MRFSLINPWPVQSPVPKALNFWYQLCHIRWHWIPCHNQSGIRGWHCRGWARAGRKTSAGSAAAIKMHDRYHQQAIRPAFAHGWGGTNVIYYCIDMMMEPCGSRDRCDAFRGTCPSADQVTSILVLLSVAPATLHLLSQPGDLFTSFSCIHKFS